MPLVLDPHVALRLGVPGFLVDRYLVRPGSQRGFATQSNSPGHPAATTDDEHMTEVTFV